VSVSIASGGGQAAQACFLAPQLGPEPAVRWQRQARVLDKLYALPAIRMLWLWKTLAGLACGKKVRK
jgi:hypothetical protein